MDLDHGKEQKQMALFSLFLLIFCECVLVNSLSLLFLSDIPIKETRVVNNKPSEEEKAILQVNLFKPFSFIARYSSQWENLFLFILRIVLSV